MKKVAVFDIDGTVFRSSLVIELVEELIRAGIFDPSVRGEYEAVKRKWLDRKGDYENYINAVVGAFVGHLKGVYYGDFVDASKRVIAEHQNRVYRFTRDFLKTLKRRGYFLLAVSQSPKTILDLFAKDAGFDKVYGRIYEIGPQDRFTGAIVDEHLIVNKAGILRRAIEKEHLTLKGSIGVGDTEGDIPFLELVEEPICFNPNKVLFTYARRMNWRVVVERKNVIYEIPTAPMKRKKQ